MYPLTYYESLLSQPVGLGVCGCNQNLHRSVCIPIDGGRALIAVLYLGLLLLAGAFCTTVEGGMLNLHRGLTLLSGS